MCSFFIYFFLNVLFFSNATKVWNESSSEENHICPRNVTKEVEVIVPYTETVKEKFTTWCFAIPPRCSRHRIKTVTKEKKITRNQTKIVPECCKGYEKIDETCLPICYDDCINGECVAPNNCLCFEGWTGPVCNTKCQSNRYGKGCKHTCACMNGATCNILNGACECKEGYIGAQCEFTCPNHTYGLHCKYGCTCEHGAFCDIKDGTCDCQPGFFGDNCEKKCENGTHGANCGETCLCFDDRTEYCHPADGTCFCKPGYKGIYCQEECSNSTYGPHCQDECDCENSDFCDPATGECLCKTGWIGKNCSEKCKPGTFGENCTFHCQPCPNDLFVCNFITGYCECPPGITGPDCDDECPQGTYGQNCSMLCDCSSEEVCDPYTGFCLNQSYNNVEHVHAIPAIDNNRNSSSDQSIYRNFINATLYIFVAVACVAIPLIVAVIFLHKRKCFRRVSGDGQDDGRNDIIVRGNFANPTYESAEVIRNIESLTEANMIRISATEKDIVSKVQTKDLQPEQSMFDLNSAAEAAMKNLNQEHAAKRPGSTGSSSSFKNKRNSSHYTKFHNTNIVAQDKEDSYEPEKLQEFGILDNSESIYLNMGFQSNPKPNDGVEVN